MLALRTQQVVAYESGVTASVDPLAGSYYVERLTTELEERSVALMGKVDALGGAERAIHAGYFQEEIARSAYEQQMALETGRRVVVGVNRFDDGREPPIMPQPDYSALEREQVTRLARVRRERNAGETERALKMLRDAAGSYAAGDRTSLRAPLVPVIIDAVRARASVGEISDTLADCWGRYRPRA